jgi:hypothetical protein
MFINYKPKNLFYMKRSKIYILLMVLGMVFMFDGCSKKDKDSDVALDCEQLANNYVNAWTAFITEGNQTEANCEAWKDALEAFINGCDYYTGYNKEDLQQQLSEIDCSVYNQAD